MSRLQGQQVESEAKDFLEHQGLKIVTSNFHSKGGEIDLIMLDKNCLVFVEVRYRASASFGSAEESVTYQKQQRILQTAQQFLQKNSQYQNLCCRFDVIACSPAQSEQHHINWIKDAFSA